MLATLTIVESNIATQAAIVLPRSRGCRRDDRVAEVADARRPICGELAGRCLASGCPIAAMVKAALDARKTGLFG